MLVPAPGAPGSPRAGSQRSSRGGRETVPQGLPLFPQPQPAVMPTCPRCFAPHRALQHTNLLQCLAQCAEVTPYLLVMEFCPLVSPVHPPLSHPAPCGAAVGLGSKVWSCGTTEGMAGLQAGCVAVLCLAGHG